MITIHTVVWEANNKIQWECMVLKTRSQNRQWFSLVASQDKAREDQLANLLGQRTTLICGSQLSVPSSLQFRLRS
jgi:hypothetical protein